MNAKPLLELEPSQPRDHKIPVLWGFIKLSPGISVWNFIGMLIHNLIFSAIYIGTELLQQNLFISPDYYDMDIYDGEQLYSYIVIQDLMTKLLTVPFYGYLCDRWGRQKTLYLAYTYIAVSYALFPVYYYKPDVFTSPLWTCIARFFSSNGVAILQVTPFLADYVDNNSKGKAISLNIPLNSTGYLVSSIIIDIMSEYNLIYSYLVYFLIATIGGFGYVSILKSGNQYYKNHDPEVPEAQEEINLNLIKKYGSQNHWIYVSFIFAILSGAGVAMLIQIFNLFIQSFPAADPVAQASKILTFSNIGAVIFSFCVGLVIDHVQQIYPIMLVFVLGSYGFFTSWMLTSSQGLFILVVAFSIGISSSTTELIANYNGFKFFPSNYRGYFFGITSMFMFLGNIIVTGVGGTLFKYFNINWPFFLSGGITIVSFVAFNYYYCKYLRKSRIDHK